MTEITPYESIEMLNKYLYIYNLSNETKGSLFENIDINNHSDTNDKLEKFYDHMHMHNILLAKNRDLIDIYIDEPITETKYTVYACINCDTNKIIYKSLSYISLLLNGIRDPVVSKIKWSIIIL
jgi:hypothetical protein